jgi:hypothetical protein
MESIRESAAVVRHWDQAGSLLITLIETVADLTDQRIDEVDPIHSVLDPDALEMIVESGHGVGGIQVSFEYEGCRVTISNSGEFVVDPIEG